MANANTLKSPRCWLVAVQHRTSPLKLSKRAIRHPPIHTSSWATAARFVLLAILISGATSHTLVAQGMATAGRTARAPIPLPEGIEPPALDFVDVAAAAGLHPRSDAVRLENFSYLTETTGAGVALIDYDTDGLTDIFLVGTGTHADDTEGQPHVLYRNLGDLRFEDVGAKAGLGSTGWGQGVCAGDVDLDGRSDLFVTHWGSDALLRNVDGSTFRNEADERGVAGEADRWSTGCSFLDYDKDGDHDLFVAHYVEFDPRATPLPGDAPQCEWKGVPIPCGPRGLAAESMSLYANDGAGLFRDVTREAGIESAKRYHGLGVLVADFDNDSWPDIFVACDSTANLLFRNQGDGTFNEVGLVSSTAYNEDGREQAGMGAGVADYDGDGLLDILQTNFADDANTVYRNLGTGSFRDLSVAAGLATVTRYVGWGVVSGDFDLDGWPDLFIANGHVAPSIDSAGTQETFAQPRLLFWNRSDGVFHPISEEAGTGILAKHPSRGTAAADLDNDGKLEVVVVNTGTRPSLLRNQADTTRNWLAVRAIARSGGFALGARATVSVNQRKMVAEVRSGGGYLSQDDLMLHFGLGGAEKAVVEIRWPSGRTSMREVSANQVVEIVEGDSSAH